MTKVTIDRVLIEQAVDAALSPYCAQDLAILAPALRAALAEPVVEPVAEVTWDGVNPNVSFIKFLPAGAGLPVGTKLYTPPAEPAPVPPAKMLTVDEIRRVADKSDEGQEPAEFMLAFARGIEAAVLRGAGLK